MYHQLYQPALQTAIRQYFGYLSPEASQALIDQLEWIQLLSGATLLEAGDPADGMYILLAGRLSVFLDSAAGHRQLISSVFRGEMVGEMGLLTDQPRTATVVASRDSVLVKIREADFKEIYEQNPALLRSFAHTIISRLQHANQRTMRQLKPNLAFVPLHPFPDVGPWLAELQSTMQHFDTTLRVDQATAAQALQLTPAELDRPEGREALNRWLAEIDSQDAFACYAADPRLSDWTRKCVRQADQMMLIADPSQGAMDEALLAYLLERRKRHPELGYQLVLLHPADTLLPQGTQRWLQRLQPERLYHLRRGHARDLRRLARFVTNRAVGLACGGGAAKGLAHVGVVRALAELGIEIDYYGGTSIGAIMGATQALDWSEAQLTAACHRTFVEGNISNDYQLPLFSLLKGRKKEQALRELFDYQIEDLWYNFLAVSCNLSTNEMVIHEQGSLWEAIAASSAIPGVFPPIIQGAHFLVDGALMNNLPGDLLKERGCDRLISVDVSASTEIHAEAEAFPSGWQAFRQRFAGKKRGHPRFPGIIQTFMRSSFLASTQHSIRVNAMADVALMPPVRKIGLMAWDKLPQATQIGYDHTMSYFAANPAKLKALTEGIPPSQPPDH